MALDCSSYLAGLNPPIHPVRHESGRYVYLCPLQMEYEPSFNVYTNDGHFHCFSCHRHGDVIGLIAAYEFHLTQGTITREVYQRYETLGGTPSSFVRNTTTTRRKAIEKPVASPEQQAMFTALAHFWHDALYASRPECETALAYARKRGIGESTLQGPWIGYAPPAEGYWINRVKDEMHRLFGSSWMELARSISFLNRDNSVRVHDRLMFSCFNAVGQAIYHQGRYVGPCLYWQKHQNPSGLQKVPFSLSLDVPFLPGTIITESPFGPAVLHQYGLRGIATLGNDTHLMLSSLIPPVYCAQDNDRPRLQSGQWVSPGEEQANTLMSRLQDWGVEHYRLRPPRKYKGLDEWVTAAGLPVLLEAMLDAQQGVTEVLAEPEKSTSNISHDMVHSTVSSV